MDLKLVFDPDLQETYHQPVQLALLGEDVRLEDVSSLQTLPERHQLRHNQAIRFVKVFGSRN